MNNKLIITPKTKVLQVIETYPQLEEVLIGYVPAFEKLRNPLLRNTVAKIATLQQAAAIGNIKVEDLINRLRAEIGQDLFSQDENNLLTTEKPSWFNESLVAGELDARPMLERGEHPVNQVISDLQSLEKGKIYKLIAPFMPAPLIDKGASLSFSHWVNKKSENEYIVYFISL